MLIKASIRETMNSFNLREWYERHVIEPMLAALEEFPEHDSGWALSRILDLTVNVNRYNPMRAKCYVKLPRDMTTKKAVINVLSTDDARFAVVDDGRSVSCRKKLGTDVVISALYNGSESQSDMEFPTTLKNIGKFERLKMYQLIFMVSRNGRFSRYGSSAVRRRSMSIYYMCKIQQCEMTAGHFTLIKNLSRFVSSQLSKKKHRKYFCDRYVCNK